MRRTTVLVVFIAVVSSCGVTATSSPPPSSPPPAPAPSGVPAADANGPLKVAAMLFPDSGRACGQTGDFTACPVTRELARRLAEGPIHYADQLCRCIGLYHAPRFAVTPVSDGAVVKADLPLDRGQQSLDLTIVHPQGVWVVSDITCAGRGTSTSVYSDSPTLCYASSG